MNELIEIVNELTKSDIKSVIDKRLGEFENAGKNKEEIFKELIFCILAAGTSAELATKTVDHLGNTIFSGTLDEIRSKLKQVYRFHTIRAGYIYNARDSFKILDLNAPNVREQLVKNIKGIGLKEASHFLRNIGKFEFAIIDFHIVDLLEKHGIFEKPKTITPKKYFEIENILQNLARKLNMSLGELDLYLWYLETGKVLK